MLIVIDVRGMPKKKLYKVQDCFFKLGYHWGVTNDDKHWNHDGDGDIEVYRGILGELGWGRLCNNKPTHTYKQLMELAKMKKLSDLNSDELRTKLTKNKGKIVKYRLQNAEIIELLRKLALPAGSLTTEDLKQEK